MEEEEHAADDFMEDLGVPVPAAPVEVLASSDAEAYPVGADIPAIGPHSKIRLMHQRLKE